MNLYLRRFISLEQALNQSLEVDELRGMIEQRQGKMQPVAAPPR